MSNRTKLRLCDWGLIVLSIVILASGIQLEITGGSDSLWIWIHVVLGTLFLVAIGWHLFLHFRWKNWFRSISRQKSPVTRWLGVFYLLTAISAVAALIHRMITYHHSPVGGVHGKIALVFMVLVVGHTLKRIKSPILIDKKKS